MQTPMKDVMGCQNNQNNQEELQPGQWLDKRYFKPFKKWVWRKHLSEGIHPNFLENKGKVGGSAFRPATFYYCHLPTKMMLVLMVLGFYLDYLEGLTSALEGNLRNE